MGQNITTKTTLRNRGRRKGDGKKRVHVHCMFLLTSNMLNIFVTRRFCPGLSSVQFPHRFAAKKSVEITYSYIGRADIVIGAL